MGDGTYQVKPTEKVVFRSGRLGLIDVAASGDCGCPAPPVPVMRAAAPPAQVVPDDNLQASVHLAQPGDEDKPVPPPSSGSIPVSSAQPSSRSEEHTSELQSLTNLVCRLLLEKKKQN